MKYTVYGIVFESNYYFDYFNQCSDSLSADMNVEVNINPNANIPSIKNFGNDYFEISQPGDVMYRYVNKKLNILAKSDNCIKSTISTIPFFLAVSQKGGVLFHAACVMSKTNRKAGIILAPSGVGKSTIANYLSTRHEEVFQFISDDATAVYTQNELPYVYNGPTFSKVEASMATLIGVTSCEKSINNKFLINCNCNVSKIYDNMEEQKIELGALFFTVPLPTTENIQIKIMDRRSTATFIKTSIIANRYNSMDVNNIMFDRAASIDNKIKSYILYYPQKKESLNIQLCNEIHEKILQQSSF